MRVSIITGGGSGIGAAVARRLAGRDECVMLHGQGADAAGLDLLGPGERSCGERTVRVGLGVAVDGDGYIVAFKRRQTGIHAAGDGAADPDDFQSTPQEAHRDSPAKRCRDQRIGIDELIDENAPVENIAFPGLDDVEKLGQRRAVRHEPGAERPLAFHMSRDIEIVVVCGANGLWRAVEVVDLPVAKSDSAEVDAHEFSRLEGDAGLT